MGNLDLLNHLIPYTPLHSSIEGLPQRIKKSLKEVNPNKIFIYNDKPLILFFKTTQELSIDTIFKKYWNFSEAPIVFIENDNNIEIYNGFDYTLENNKPIPKKLDSDNLSYLSLISGEYFQSEAFQKSDTKLDTVLLKNIKDTREKLLIEMSNLSLKNKLMELSKTKDTKKRKRIFKSFSLEEDVEYTQIQHIANALLGRIIFIRYLIDREISLFYQDKKQTITNDDFKEILSNKIRTYQFFSDLQSSEKGFNGDWFPIELDEKNIIKEEHLLILKELISGTEISSGQRSLFDYYDFSIIPIEFISNVYEHFIGEEKQKEDGAYYTPTFLVDYVLKYTVDAYFKINPNTYNCKILDPACGSGIFLVETFRKLVAQYEKITDKKPSEDILKQLIKDNIFGIDKNKNALQISVFSLYLSLLDYQKPKDIENFKFPYLLDSDKNKDKPNFFENDFFDVNAPYNKILKKEKLNFIIGNPPYGRSSIKPKSFAAEYVKKENLSIGNNDIVQPFMVRVKDLSQTAIQVGFIVTSKVLYNSNLKAQNFRTKHFFNNFKVNHILELSSVRNQIFVNAKTPVSIIFYNYGTKNEIEKNIIKYISMKPSPFFEKLKFLLISKNDFKKVAQPKLLKYDYLWKILVYGSYLDFNLIKKLKKEYKTILRETTNTSTGVNLGNRQNPIPSSYCNKPYIQTKHFKKFFLRDSKDRWLEKYAESYREIGVFQSPSLLVAKGVDSKTIDMKLAMLHKDSIFRDGITSIKTEQIETLYAIMGLLSSSFFKYFILNSGSSIGVEREQVHNPEKFSMPFVYNDDIAKLAQSLEEYSKNDFAQYGIEFDNLRNKLNICVLKAFNLSEQEHALVDYATNLVIPWVIQKKYDVALSQYNYQDNRIDEYVQIFTDHYVKLYKDKDLCFQATVHWSRYAIGIYFKTFKSKPNELIVWKQEENIENFLKLMQGKTLENLFIQKDIKGFESDGFYVVKPNEIKNWHKAIGYLDFYEFKDAILRAGKSQWQN